MAEQIQKCPDCDELLVKLGSASMLDDLERLLDAISEKCGNADPCGPFGNVKKLACPLAEWLEKARAIAGEEEPIGIARTTAPRYVAYGFDYVDEGKRYRLRLYYSDDPATANLGAPWSIAIEGPGEDSNGWMQAAVLRAAADFIESYEIKEGQQPPKRKVGPDPIKDDEPPDDWEPAKGDGDG